MLPRVSVIILNYNGVEDTLGCLKSLGKVNYPNFEVIVLDNGSRNDVDSRFRGNDGGRGNDRSSGDDAKILKDFSGLGEGKYRFIDNEKNLGFAGGCNIGIELVLKEGKSEYVYLLNNDTEADSEFLAEAVKVAENAEKNGIVTSKSLYFGDRNIIENVGHYLLDCGDVSSRGRGMKATEFINEEELLSACGAGVLLRVSMLMEIGLFREEFFLNYEDVDLCLRSVLMGWKCIYAPKSMIYHKVSASIENSRNYDMNLRTQFNQLKAYYYNVPLTVLLLNFPFIVLRFFMVLIGGIIFGQWRMVVIFLHAHVKFFVGFMSLTKERRKLMREKKVSAWYILKKQKNFVWIYFRYFWDIVVRRKKSIFDAR